MPHIVNKIYPILLHVMVDGSLSLVYLIPLVDYSTVDLSISLMMSLGVVISFCLLQIVLL